MGHHGTWRQVVRAWSSWFLSRPQRVTYSQREGVSLNLGREGCAPGPVAGWCDTPRRPRWQPVGIMGASPERRSRDVVTLGGLLGGAGMRREGSIRWAPANRWWQVRLRRSVHRDAPARGRPGAGSGRSWSASLPGPRSPRSRSAAPYRSAAGGRSRRGRAHRSGPRPRANGSAARRLVPSRSRRAGAVPGYTGRCPARMAAPARAPERYVLPTPVVPVMRACWRAATKRNIPRLGVSVGQRSGGRQQAGRSRRGRGLPGPYAICTRA